MLPYNFKMPRRHPLELMSTSVAGRSAVPDMNVERILQNLLADHDDDVSWGPNNMFELARCSTPGCLFNQIDEVA